MYTYIHELRLVCLWVVVMPAFQTLHLALPPFTAYKILEEFYGLRLADLKRFSAGSSNLTYRAVTFTDVVTVSLLFGDTMEEAGRLADMANTLAEQGIPTPRVLPTTAGQYVVNVDGIPLLVREYAQGNHPDVNDPDTCFLVGKTLAEAHALAAYEGGPTRCLPLNWADRLADCEDEAFVLWVAESADLLVDLPADLPVGFVHADLFPDNVIINEKHVSLIDWELGGNDRLAMDLAVALVGFLSSGMKTPEPLLSGYESERRLTGDERDALPQLLTYATAHLAFQRYLSARTHTPTRKAHGWYRELFNWWTQADATAFVN
jgi:Ser/Thr protein kinase RdoA (MazF antagonist)